MKKKESEQELNKELDVMRKKLSIALSLFLFTFFILSVVPTNVVHAESNGEVNRSPLAEDGETLYYELEAGMPDDDKSSWYDLIGKTGDAVTVALNEAIMFINKVIFKLNVKASSWLIGTMEMTQDFNFIDKAINDVAVKVKDIVGVSGSSEPTFTSSGLFGALVKIIALIVVIYAFYQLVWKRSFISSFGELLKFIVVLATSLLLFTNYSTFLTGMNDLSDEIGGLIVGAESEDSHNSRVDTFSQTLWDHFVDRTYLTLQYGTTDLSSLDVDGIDGETRVRELLTASKRSSERADIVDTEINDRENYYMTYDSVSEKTFLNFLLFGLNAFTSIPVLLVALAIIFTQFWFIIIALIAPFALLIASFPSQFGVLKRYFFELSLPLLIKIGLHFVLVIIMFLTGIVSDVYAEISSDMFGGQIGSAFIYSIFYTMLFFGVFLLRKRITGILSSGSQMVGEIREGMSSLTTKPAKQAVQAGTTAVGAVGGAIVAGPQGAMVGASMGATAGKMATGGTDVAGATQDITRTAYQAQMLSHMNDRKAQNNKMNEQGQDLTPEQKEAKEIRASEFKEKQKQGYANTEEFTKEKGMSDSGSKQFVKAMEKEEVDFSKVSKETLNRHYEENINLETGEAKPKEVAKSIKEHQNKESAKIQELRSKRRERFNDFMEQQNLTQHEMKEINDHLKSKAIDVATLPKSDYVNVDKEIRGKLEQGELVDYKEEFKKGVEEKAVARKLEKQKERITQSQKTETNKVPTASLKPNINDHGSSSEEIPTSSLNNNPSDDSEDERK